MYSNLLQGAVNIKGHLTPWQNVTIMILTQSIPKQSKEKQDGEKMDFEGNVKE